MSTAHLVKARELMEAVIALVRAFGLHRPDQLPCGRPISVAEVHALMDMHAAGPISQRDLAAGLCLEKSTVSRLVRLMEGRGWVKRTIATHDRRVMHVSLSAAGKTAARRLTRARGARFARVLAAIPHDQRVSVVDAVSALVRAARNAVARDALKLQTSNHEQAGGGPKNPSPKRGVTARRGAGPRMSDSFGENSPRS